MTPQPGEAAPPAQPASATAPPEASSGPDVRFAGPSDVAQVARLLSEFRDWQGRDRPTDAALRAGVERLMRDPGAECLLAARPQAQDAVGVCQLRFRFGLWHAAEDCWLEDLFVSEGVRGEGVGGALVRAAIDRARERGCRRIELDTLSDNQAALGLYEEHGFSARDAGGATRVMLRLHL